MCAMSGLLGEGLINDDTMGHHKPELNRRRETRLS